MLIINVTLVTWGDPNEILPDHALYIEYGTIRDIGTTRELIEKYPDIERLDARGQLVMPGSICAHTHFYGAFARGMAIPGDPPKDFPEILQRLWWKLDKALTLDDVRYSALVCLVDAVRHGTTTLIDHHASPNAIDGSLDVIDGLLAYDGEELDEYITRRFAIYAPGGGFIFNGGHFIQPDIPPMRLVRAYRLVNELAKQYHG